MGASANGDRFVDRFCAVVAANPDANAVVVDGKAITFAELDAWSRDVAAAIGAQVGSGPEPVMVLAGHDTEAVVGFVGAALAGRPFVMLDSTTPAGRIAQISELAGPVATLVGTGYAGLAAAAGPVLGPTIGVGAESVRGGPVSGESPSRGPHRAEGGDVVPLDDGVLSIVFTSGSTGVPKGVVLGDVEFCLENAEAGPHDATRQRVGCPQPLSFIMGLAGVAKALLLGHEAHLFDPRRAGIAEMVPWVVDNQLTQLSLTPHMMRSLAAAARRAGTTMDSLEFVTAGGEALLAADVRALWEVTGPGLEIMNGFGSSEGWFVAAYEIKRDAELPAVGGVPLGNPPDGRETFLLDEDGSRITEPGRTGMIMIAAERMSRGYWKRPDLTASRFERLPDGRAQYTTGDLGRWNAAGQLEIAGRSDHMLKIRGYLVEPAEVENQILADGAVEECVVVGAPGRVAGSKRLVAYVEPRPGAWLSGSALRRSLARTLPGYMVPSQVVELDVLPRTPNGKVDRLRLPDPPEAPGDDDGTPTTSLHHAIAHICAGALGLEHVGKNDDLFALGADSLAIEEIVAALGSELHLHVTSATLNERSTVAELAELPRSSAQNLVGGVLVTLAKPSRSRVEAPPGAQVAPLFLVAGAAGLAVSFRDLAQLVGKERPVYGLQAKGLEGPGVPDFSIARTARRYVHAMRQVRPEGPYHLAGHSLGAFVAFEMAHQLRRDGQEVALLALLDPLGGDDAPGGELVMRNQVAEATSDAPAPEPGGEASSGILARLRAATAESRPYLLRSFWRTMHDKPFVSYWELGKAMARHYDLTAHPLDGVPTVVYAAKEMQPGAGQLDWAQFVAPVPRVVPVDGDHLSMLRRPFVSSLASELAAELAVR